MNSNLTNSFWTSFLQKVVMLFVTLFIASFSFPHYYIPDIGAYTHVFFEKIMAWFAQTILQLKKPYTIELISDSTGMYVNAFLLLIISFLLAFIWQKIDKKNRAAKCFIWFKIFVRYYLALQMLVYGFNKVFKWQFYLPEPNTLFTTIGNSYKDILFWSTMGISRTYSVFTGCCEVFAAVLLLFRKTCLLGAITTFAIMANVFMLNLCFDISVKLYSLFLIFLSILLIVPHVKFLFNFLILKKATQLPTEKGVSLIVRKKNILPYLKWLIVFILFADSLALYFEEKNFNDDKFPRTYLHGAYTVVDFVRNNDTLQPLLTDGFRWKRIFVHRRGYLITQLMNDDMKDYELAIDSAKKEFLFQSNEDSIVHSLAYKIDADSLIMLKGKFYDDSIHLKLKKINLQNLPLLKNEFSWTIDE